MCEACENSGPAALTIIKRTEGMQNWGMKALIRQQALKKPHYLNPRGAACHGGVREKCCGGLLTEVGQRRQRPEKQEPEIKRSGEGTELKKEGAKRKHGTGLQQREAMPHWASHNCPLDILVLIHKEEFSIVQWKLFHQCKLLSFPCTLFWAFSWPPYKSQFWGIQLENESLLN